MNSANYRVRRATLDDLETLRPIWESMRLPVQDLEKRLTEFQVAAAADGRIVGAVGLQMMGRHALIRDEGFSDFAAAEAVRPLFWDRIQTLAINHGIVRLWTQEEAPFWKQHGLQPANAEAFKKLPPVWGQPNSAWLTLQLKSEESVVSLEKELALFMEAEKQRTARVFQHARTAKLVAILLVFTLVVVVIGAMFFLIRKNPGILERFGH